MCLTDDQRKKIRPFLLLVLASALVVALLFIANGYLFPSEVSSKFEDEKAFIEWYKKALEAYQSAATLFSAWAASCIIAGYTLIKDLKPDNKFFKTSIVVFAMLVLSCIFDLYLSQAYYSYYTYVFQNDYPIFSATIARHIRVQEYTQLLMFVFLFFLSGVSLIRTLS